MIQAKREKRKMLRRQKAILKQCRLRFQNQRFMRYRLSLRENVQAFDTSSQDDPKKALDRAGLALDAKTFPQGMETVLSREIEGVDISGGQWQPLIRWRKRRCIGNSRPLHGTSPP